MGVISIFGDRDSFWQSGQILYRVLEAFVIAEHRDRRTGQEDLVAAPSFRYRFGAANQVTRW
ncbi:MAG: hypothetical protein CMM01_16630 [Rhodopirellula sp.]|nr:hypothetical protein [Rhodopirellula sp.]